MNMFGNVFIFVFVLCLFSLIYLFVKQNLKVYLCSSFLKLFKNKLGGGGGSGGGGGGSRGGGGSSGGDDFVNKIKTFFFFFQYFQKQ